MKRLARRYHPYLSTSILSFLTALTLTACHAQGSSLEESPLCAPCIARLCDDVPSDLAPLFEKLNQLGAGEQAQWIAETERYPGCAQRLALPSGFVEAAYAHFAPSFFDVKQPYLVDRARRAIDALQGAQADYALAYLRQHLPQWRDTELRQRFDAEIKPLLDKPAIFDLAVALAEGEELQRLAKMTMSPERDAALLWRWPELDAETQARILAPFVSGHFEMQSSGSSQYHQYLALTWSLLPLPEGVPPLAASMEIKRLRINNNEAKRGQRFAKALFDLRPLREANARRSQVDLQSWLNIASHYRISTEATLKLWPQDVSDACLLGEAHCEHKALLEKPVLYERSYRVFAGVETGAPRRQRDKRLNDIAIEGLELSLCNRQGCSVLWQNGKANKTLKLEIYDGEDFYVLARHQGMTLPLAVRLMGKASATQSWQELAALLHYAPQHFALPARSNIDLGSLCPTFGNCQLDLQLRPSLRMARSDARVQQYWGESLDLGSVTLDILSLSPAQVWASVKSSLP